MWAAFAVWLVLSLAGCKHVELPQTEEEAIAYVKSRVHPYEYDPEFTGFSLAKHNSLVEQCRSFLKYARWSAFRQEYPSYKSTGWLVSGSVSSSVPRAIRSIPSWFESYEFREYMNGVGGDTWAIMSSGELVSIGSTFEMPVLCDHD